MPPLTSMFFTLCYRGVGSSDTTRKIYDTESDFRKKGCRRYCLLAAVSSERGGRCNNLLVESFGP